MPDAGFLLLINISIGALFAVSFVGFSRQSKFKLGYWSAAGFVAAALTTLVESFANMLSPWVASSLSYGFLLTALSCIFIGIWQHYHKHGRSVVGITTAFFVMSLTFHQLVLLEAPRDGALHAIGYQTSFAVLSLGSSVAIMIGARRKLVDLILSLVLAIMGVQFWLKSWLAYEISTGRSTQTYIYSQYALYSQTAAAILSLSLGVVLLALIVTEVFGSKLDRAYRDELSGLLGRDAFVAATCDKNGIIRSRQSGCFLLADLDYFKKINDTFGHEAGDIVISIFGRILLAVVPPYSLCGRLGGEEFAALMPDKNINVAIEIANEVREMLERYQFVFAPDARFTVSIGITVYENEELFSSVLKRADIALYRAKRLGRNQCEVELPDRRFYASQRRSQTRSYP